MEWAIPSLVIIIIIIFATVVTASKPHRAAKKANIQWEKTKQIYYNKYDLLITKLFGNAKYYTMKANGVRLKVWRDKNYLYLIPYAEDALTVIVYPSDRRRHKGSIIIDNYECIVNEDHVEGLFTRLKNNKYSYPDSYANMPLKVDMDKITWKINSISYETTTPGSTIMSTTTRTEGGNISAKGVIAGAVIAGVPGAVVGGLLGRKPTVSRSTTDVYHKPAKTNFHRHENIILEYNIDRADVVKDIYEENIGRDPKKYYTESTLNHKAYKNIKELHYISIPMEYFDILNNLIPERFIKR